MHAPLSMILFTTLAGLAQGLLLALVGLDIAVHWGLGVLPGGMRDWGAAIVLVLGVIGLAAATFHLGHPLRAWRAAAMWRSSWLSREVIVLPLFLAFTFVWAVAQHFQALQLSFWAGIAAAAMALLLFLCTGMIYGAVKTIAEWATPMTPLNFTLLGSASGFLAASALAAVWLPAHSAALIARMALMLLLAGTACRLATALRNRSLAAKTTLQTAIGVRHPRIVQSSQGMMGGTFNSREFFHGKTASFVLVMRCAAVIFAAAVPAVGLMVASSPWSLAGLMVLMWLGLLAERWLFFAEARHPQNVYQQRIG